MKKKDWEALANEDSTERASDSTEKRATKKPTLKRSAESGSQSPSPHQPTKESSLEKKHKVWIAVIVTLLAVVYWWPYIWNTLAPLPPDDRQKYELSISSHFCCISRVDISGLYVPGLKGDLSMRSRIRVTARGRRRVERLARSLARGMFCFHGKGVSE